MRNANADSTCDKTLLYFHFFTILEKLALF